MDAETLETGVRLPVVVVPYSFDYLLSFVFGVHLGIAVVNTFVVAAAVVVVDHQH